MTVRKYSSRSQQTTLSSPITSTASTMSVVNGASIMGGKTLTGTQTYTVVIDPDTALEEIVDVTVYSSGNTLTITRGVDGPTPGTGSAHSAGAVVRHMAIGRDYQEANDHIESLRANSATAHGIPLATIILNSDTGTVTNTMLAANAVTTAKITDANVTTAKIADSAITSTKIADLTIATGDIADSAITSGKIATGAVGTTKIDDLSITEAKIAPNAITTGKIADGTIVAGDLADGAVTSAKILDGTIVNADINAAAAIAYSKLALTGAITSADIANDTIVNADINSTAGIAYSKLSLGGSITSADLVDGTIVNSDINASAGIALSKLATDPLARANHTGTQTASTVSDFDTQVRTSKVTDLAAPTAAFSMNSQKITSLGTPTTGTDASTKAYVDAQITALVGGAPGTLDTLKEIADAISSGGSFESTVVLKSGSTMTGALTLSGAPTTSLHAATKAYVDTVAGSATAAAASAADAATTYDNFDDRYLGAKASPPTLDNDGNALMVGALYWNSVSAAMFAWTGSAWGSISSTAAIFRYRFTATAGQTTISGIDDNGLTLSYLVGKEQVYLNGVLLARTSDYTASTGTSITSLAALTAGDILEIITFTAFDVATAIANSTFTAKGDLLVATSASVPGKVAVGTNGQYLQADSTTATGLKWATVSGYSAPTLGSTSIASGATVTTIADLTLTSPIINFATTTAPVLVSPEERITVAAIAATGTVQFDADTQGVLYYTTNASADWTLNVRGTSGTTLNSKLAIGDSTTISFLVTNGTTAYKHSALTIDGVAQTVKFSGGTAPAAGNASSIDAYSFTIIKTASATYTVLGAGPVKYG
jgi:hypothetical protein